MAAPTSPTLFYPAISWTKRATLRPVVLRWAGDAGYSGVFARC
jgi:hypothetical protein